MLATGSWVATVLAKCCTMSNTVLEALFRFFRTISQSSHNRRTCLERYNIVVNPNFVCGECKTETPGRTRFKVFGRRIYVVVDNLQDRRCIKYSFRPRRFTQGHYIK